MALEYTPIDDIPKVHQELNKAFLKRVSLPIAWRQHQLLQIARMLQENHQAFADALHKDLGRPAHEAYTMEITAMIERAITSAKALPEWAAAENKEDVVPEWQKSWKPTVYRTPKGVVLVIAPWNYPLILSVQPLMGAIAAGCPAVLKPSEVSANVAAVLAEYLPKYLDNSAYKVVNGSVKETTKLLELKWDHIFYTGNGTVARIISAAAAKHLTPMTLELGGKSPVIIDPEVDLEVAAKRVLYGKLSNAGQLCVTPDYIYIPTGKHPDAVTKFVEAFKKAVKECWPEGSLGSSDFSHIINQNHFKRVSSIIERTKGKVVVGGGKNEETLKMEITMVVGVEKDDSVLEGENFGPLIPIVEVKTIEEAIQMISERDHPLVLYAFTNSEQTKQYIRDNTMSGAIVYNDTVIQLAVNELPFGGVGESGYGRQVLRYTYEAFSYLRTSVDIPYEAESMLAGRYPPYTKEKWDAMVAPVLNMPIPASTAQGGLSS
ncbi:Hexadecenal dehydrogenase [Marasmius crinis-equi]|uniref:Aldehyde dehydrogenase n=1 Tax=Marasmius crinis-equi TaxID=585013 RepID=A0ABR3FC28_9AGAR